MDLILRGGTVVTAGDTYDADIGIKGGKVLAQPGRGRLLKRDCFSETVARL